MSTLARLVKVKMLRPLLPIQMLLPLLVGLEPVPANPMRERYSQSALFSPATGLLQLNARVDRLEGESRALKEVSTQVSGRDKG